MGAPRPKMYRKGCAGMCLWELAGGCGGSRGLKSIKGWGWPGGPGMVAAGLGRVKPGWQLQHWTSCDCASVAIVICSNEGDGALKPEARQQAQQGASPACMQHLAATHCCSSCRAAGRWHTIPAQRCC